MAETPMIPLAKPWMGEPEAAAARRAILSGWVTQGPEVAAFEREFAEFCGAPFACAVSNCTTALHLSLLAAGVGPGDDVLTVSHSFIATANAVRQAGARPVFVDIDPATFNMDPAGLAEALTPKTRAVLCVHQLGMPCDLSAILAFARPRGLPVIEDSACAIGSEILWNGNWERIGRPHADISCFSFHPRKLLTTGDGGMITTANPEYDRKFRLWRQHGMSVPDTVRHGSKQVVFENYLEPGFNYRMTDVQAAMGREQLKRIPVMVGRRRMLADRYRGLLAGIPGLVLPHEPTWARSNWQSYCVRLPEGVDQAAVMQSMLDAGVSLRRGVMCSHREAAYPPGTWSCGTQAQVCGCGPSACRRLAHSERMQDRCIILPLFHEMTEADQDRVADALLRACRK